MSTTLPPAAQAALDAGNKILAIKIVRETMGIGLAESKALVDAASRGRPEIAGSANAQLADLLIPALEALRQGRLIEGIKILRRSGLGLAEAKALLEKAQREGTSLVGTTARVEPSGELPLKAMLALREGQMVEAVREYRAQHGCGLKEAREGLEAHLAADPLLQRQFREMQAANRSAVVQKVAMIVAVVVLLGAWLVYRSSS